MHSREVGKKTIGLSESSRQIFVPYFSVRTKGVSFLNTYLATSPAERRQPADSPAETSDRSMTAFHRNKDQLGRPYAASNTFHWSHHRKRAVFTKKQHAGKSELDFPP